MSGVIVTPVENRQVVETDSGTQVVEQVLSVSGGGAPSGAAGGVLSGTYPDPAFASDMATQAELDAVASAKQDAATAATDAELTAHAADTTAVHGIADTAALATSADLAAKLAVASNLSDLASANAALVSLGLLPSVGTYAAEVMADTPALYFKGAPAAGTTAVDSSGNGKDATMNGAVAPGAALLGDGNSSFEISGAGSVQRGGGDIYSDNDSRVSVWEAVCQLGVVDGTTSQTCGIFGSPNGSGPAVYAYGPELRISATGTYGFANSIPAEAVLFHLAVVMDGPKNGMQAFINGRAIGYARWTNWNAGGYAYQFGAIYANSSPWIGKLNHVAIYHHDVSAARIRAHAHAAGLYSPLP